ncbi:MAG: ABC transporter permease [Nocardioides sp.]
MSGHYAPQPGAAPPMRRIYAQARMEARLMVRNGEQLVLALAIPLVTLVAGSFAIEKFSADWSSRPLTLLVPGVFALAVMSTSFTALAIATGFERRAGVLRRLAVSPLAISGLLAGKVGALLAVQACQAVAIGIAATAMGWRPSLSGVCFAALVAVLGTTAFAGLALTLAGALRAEATLAAANLAHLLLMFGGAVLLPRTAYGSAEAWLTYLPSAALGDAMRAAFIDGRLAPIPALILVAWSLLGAGLAARWFRWD